MKRIFALLPAALPALGPADGAELLRVAEALGPSRYLEAGRIIL